MNPTATAVPTDPAPVTERGPRPATATVAAALQLGIVLLALGLIAAAWIGYISHDEMIDRAVKLVPEADPEVVASERSSNRFGSVMASVLSSGIALWFGATLWPVWRGSNLARVVTAVGAGMQTAVAVLISCGGGVFGLMFLPLIAGDPGLEGGDPLTDPGLYEEDPFYDKLFQLQDSGAGMLPGMVLGIGMMLLALLAGALLVLLLVPPSNRWFSPRPPSPVATGVPIYYPVYYQGPGLLPGAPPPVPAKQSPSTSPPATPPEPPSVL